MTIIAVFHETAAQVTNLTGEKDKLVRKVDSMGVFTVRSAYRDLISTEAQETGWPRRMIWKTKFSYKV